MTLDGKTVAILIAPRGTEDPEFAKPKKAIEEAGATLVVVGLEPGKAETVNHDLDPGSKYSVDKPIGEVTVGAFDALIVPGGCVGADKLRAEPKVVAFVRDFVESGKPVAVICHGPWTLAEAGVLEGRTLTSFHSIRTDLENAGATWVDQEVCVDGNLVTSRNPDDLPAFCAKIVELIGQGQAARQAENA